MTEDLEKYKPGKGGKNTPDKTGEDIPPWADDDRYDASNFDGGLDEHCAWRACNDLGNSERLIARFGEDLIYVENSGWYAWDGVRWNREEGAMRAQIAAQKTAKGIRAEAKVQSDKDDKSRAKLLAEWARDSGASGKITAMQKEARPHLMVKGDELDVDKFLFTCQSATLRLGVRVEPIEHDRSHHITRTAGGVFDENVDAPEFHKFLKKIIPDKELREFLQVWFGYCLTGDVAEQVLVMLLGSGSNGKSTLLNCIDYVVGDYHMTLPIESLMKKENKQGSGPSPDIARLPGARMVTTSEPEVGSQFSESIIKQITGGEKMTARHLNQGFFEFLPEFKVTISANNKPRIRGQDDGIWRRLLLVPFTEKVDREDVSLVYGALESEAAGILKWLTDGAEKWFENGLNVPARIRAAVDEYRADSNPLREFIADCVILTDSDVDSLPGGQLHSVYQAWAKDNGIEPVWNMTLFGRRMGEANHRKVKRGGLKHYLGMRLKEKPVAEGDQAGDPRPEPPPHNPDGDTEKP